MEIFRGIIRESNYNNKCPSTWFGFDDWLKDADILLDDIYETVLIKHPIQGIGFFTYDEFDKLKENGLRGVRSGRFLRESI